MANAKRPYHHGNLRQALLETAHEMLQGTDGWQFTLRELARRAGVSHTASYKHFPDKAGLLAELAMLGFDTLRTELLAARPGRETGQRETFLAMSEAYVRFGVENANLYRLMFSADARRAASAQLKSQADAALQVLVDVLEEGQRRGWLRAKSAQAQAAASWAQLHGITLLNIDGWFDERTVGADGTRRALEVLLEGLERRG
jgi:AcrR family transcriptional regulator